MRTKRGAWRCGVEKMQPEQGSAARAFFPTDDSANPDTEIIAAIRPAMSTIPNAMLLCASSPYAQRGALFDAFKRHYAKDSPVLVWRAPTRTMNPTVPQSVVDAAMEADPQSAAAEYLAQYRIDVQLFVSRDAIEAAVIAGRFELPRVEGIRYHAFVDPSGGSSDSMTLCVAHISGQPRRRRSDPRALCSVLARRLRQRIFGRAPQPRRRPDRRRPLRRRVAARGLPQARRRLSRRRQDEVRSLSCPAAAAEQRPRRIARQQAPRRSALRPGAAHVALRQGLDRPRPRRPRRRRQRRGRSGGADYRGRCPAQGADRVAGVLQPTNGLGRLRRGE